MCVYNTSYKICTQLCYVLSFCNFSLIRVIYQHTIANTFCFSLNILTFQTVLPTVY